MDSPLQQSQPTRRPLGGFWPGVLPPPSRRRALIALAVAGVSDVISVSVSLMVPVELAVDLVTAIVLWILLGARWPLLPAFIAEAIPFVSMFPTWTMVAGAYLWYSRRGDGGAT
jgi:hypothetical protein